MHCRCEEPFTTNFEIEDAWDETRENDGMHRIKHLSLHASFLWFPARWMNCAKRRLRKIIKFEQQSPHKLIYTHTHTHERVVFDKWNKSSLISELNVFSFCFHRFQLTEKSPFIETLHKIAFFFLSRANWLKIR